MTSYDVSMFEVVVASVVGLVVVDAAAWYTWEWVRKRREKRVGP